METKLELVKAQPDHAHRWLIEEARGPQSRGTCRVCGTEKMFRNWLEDADFITNEEHRQAA
ncbi:MAG: hypothetical protein IT303_19440 [Dehalococcoidia bacterium]|nr:hypothetical protein [Dehalococcoidia bacterium]